MDPHRDLLIIPVAVVVCLAWLVALAAGVLKGSYTPLTITTPVMLLLAGYVFGANIIRTAKNGDRAGQ